MKTDGIEANVFAIVLDGSDAKEILVKTGMPLIPQYKEQAWDAALDLLNGRFGKQNVAYLQWAHEVAEHVAKGSGEDLPESKPEEFSLDW